MNFKGRLQEMAQRHGWVMPTYEIVPKDDGFEACCRVLSGEFCGSGNSKKAAAQSAAAHALERVFAGTMLIRVDMSNYAFHPLVYKEIFVSVIDPKNWVDVTISFQYLGGGVYRPLSVFSRPEGTPLLETIRSTLDAMAETLPYGGGRVHVTVEKILVADD